MRTTSATERSGPHARTRSRGRQLRRDRRLDPLGLPPQTARMQAAVDSAARNDQGLEVRVAVFENDALADRWFNPAWHERFERVARAALEARIDAIDPARTHRIVFMGGDPFSHPDLGTLVSRARARGVAEIAVQCEASRFAERSRVDEVVALGIDRLFVVVGGVRRKVYEHVMQRPGDFEPSMAGLRALLDAHRGVYVIFPLLRANADDAEPLLDWLLCLPNSPRGYLLDLPDIRAVPPQARRGLLSYREQACIAPRVFRSAQRNRLEYGFSSRRGLSPCATDGELDTFGTVFYERMQFLRREPPAQFVRVDACAECSLRDSCPGLETAYVEAFGTEGLAPVPLNVSMNWKLRPLNKLEKREYKNVSDFENETGGSARSLVRINGHCNMACAFCFVDRTAPDFDVETLKQEISQFALKNHDHLVLSGGEPTLHPELPALIRHARSQGFATVEMQSNGVRCADEEYTKLLVDAGLDKVTVSLHSVDPEHSNEITMLPGAFPKTVQAIHHFRKHGVLTQIAHVITKANYRELPDTVRFLRREFPAEGGHLSICFAIAQGISDLVYHWVIPRFDEIKPYFRDALDYCLETGIGFGGMIGQGGYPPCMLDGEMKYYEQVLGFIYRSPESDAQFYKAPRCSECSFDAHCVGPRRAYVDHFGDDEIKPFRADFVMPPPRAQSTQALLADVPDVPEGLVARARSEQLVSIGRKPRA